MNQKKFIERYKEDYEDKVIEYMISISLALVSKYGEVPDTFVISLDALANNLSIMLNAMKDMKIEGITDDDRYHGKKKSAALQTYFQAQSYVDRALASFGCTPLSKNNLRNDDKSVDLKNLLEDLTA